MSQRRDAIDGRDETRDALDVRLAGLLWSLGFVPIPLCSAVAAAQGDATDNACAAAAYLDALAPEGIVLSGGNDIGQAPERDRLEHAALAYARLPGVPVLGICRGLQMIHVHQGGELEPLSGHVAVEHTVTGAWLGGQRRVNSYHDLGLAEEALGAELEPLAWAEDGSVEALRHRDLPWLGIMWHPERDTPTSEADRTLIKSHLEARL
ncbi:gamma-glutamyl-gamma-aminobutyrate hydrolase family protein [Halorhodospira halophila]|uniref:gamma-glutamyl-gamma-aminobutyrate hydrolase family protein n=1 Tax=Halorhodospira halophila TaxID=1053 RepID=UPI001912B862